MSQNNYQKILQEIGEAAANCGRDPSSVALIAVTKQVDWQTASFLYALGQRNFGENRVDDALEKKAIAPQDCQWHFIGNLQKNKVRKAVDQFTLIHSVDSLELAERISSVSQEVGVITPILLQANTSGEISKSGLNPNEWKEHWEAVLALPGISVKGLMTMAPFTDDTGTIRQCFRGLRTSRDELQQIAGKRADLSELSMGMSHDFKIAIEEGATMVRVGTALFK